MYSFAALSQSSPRPVVASRLNDAAARRLMALLGLMLLGAALLLPLGAQAIGTGSSSSSSSSSSASYGGQTTASADEPDALALFEEALDFIERGWYRRAISNLQQVTYMEPGNADAWNELGFSYRNVENYRQSEAAYKRALGLDPEHLGALNYQGYLYIETGRVEQARENLSTLGALCGNCYAYTNLKEALDAL
jgi:Flp pilus assembly protein TadD